MDNPVAIPIGQTVEFPPSVKRVEVSLIIIDDAAEEKSALATLQIKTGDIVYTKEIPPTTEITFEIGGGSIMNEKTSRFDVSASWKE